MRDEMYKQMTNNLIDAQNDYIAKEIEELFGVQIFKNGKVLTEEALEIIPLLEFEKTKIPKGTVYEDSEWKSAYTVEIPFPKLTSESIQKVKEYLKNKNAPNLLEIKVKDLDSMPEVYYQGQKIEAKIAVDYQWRNSQTPKNGAHNLSIERYRDSTIEEIRKKNIFFDE